MKEIPKQWHVIASNIEEAKIIGKWFDQSEWHATNPNFYEQDEFVGAYGGIEPGNVHNNYIGTELSFDDFVKYIINKKDINPFIQTEDYNQILINLLEQ